MIAIANYGLGNVKAFANIYHRLNIPFEIAESSSQILAANRLILPGVGSFDYAMDKLDSSGLLPAMEEIVLARRRPVLGICVGMQMLANCSEEGRRKGLGWIPGNVVKIKTDGIAQDSVPLPHMGWNSINIERRSPITSDIAFGARFYFLHSYCFRCDLDGNEIASVEYGSKFSSIVQNGNIYGVQFHPEKSHVNGVRLLQNFASL